MIVLNSHPASTKFKHKILQKKMMIVCSNYNVYVRYLKHIAVCGIIVNAYTQITNTQNVQPNLHNIFGNQNYQLTYYIFQMHDTNS